MEYQYVTSLRKFRSVESGQFVSAATVKSYVNQSLASRNDKVSSLASMVANKEISPAMFRELMREQIKREYMEQYFLGVGGRNAMTFSDWGTLGRMLKDQYAYLSGFEKAIEGGNLTLGQISTRASMYIDSARQAFERARAKAWGLPALPAYPGDGNSICLTRCKCGWEFKEVANGGIDAYWRLGTADHCETCKTRSDTWNPLMIREGVITNL